MKLIKGIILLLSAYGLYQLLLQLSFKAIIELSKDDEVDAPFDYSLLDHKHLNDISKGQVDYHKF